MYTVTVGWKIVLADDSGQKYSCCVDRADSTSAM